MMTSGTDPTNNQQYGQNQGYQPPNNNNYQPQQNYSPQPVVINSQPQNNVIIANDPNMYRTSSVLATCPACKITSNTRVETSCSCSNVLCCLFTDPIIWLIFQAVRGKDINCCDARHTCSSCGSLMGTYNAC